MHLLVVIFCAMCLVFFVDIHYKMNAIFWLANAKFSKSKRCLVILIFFGEQENGALSDEIARSEMKLQRAKVERK